MLSLKQCFEHPVVRRYRVLALLLAGIACALPASVAVMNVVMDAPLFWWPTSEIASASVLLDAARDACARDRLLDGKAGLDTRVSRWDDHSSRSSRGISVGKAWTVSDVAAIRYRCARDTAAAVDRSRVSAARAAASQIDAERAAEQLRVIQSAGSAPAARTQG